MDRGCRRAASQTKLHVGSALAFALVLPACGARSGLELGDAGGAMVDAPIEVAVDAAPPPDVEPPPEEFGVVSFGADDTSGKLGAGAGFGRTPPMPACEGPFVVGECHFGPCRFGDSGGFNAGTVTLANGSRRIDLVPVISSGKAIYPNFYQPWDLSDSGPFHVSAPGAEVDGFEGDISLPSPLTAVEPKDSTVTLDSTSDLLLRWTGGAPLVLVVASAYAQEGICLFDATVGSARVPAAILQDVRATTVSGIVRVDVHPFARTEIHRGRWRIDLHAMRTPSSSYEVGFR